MVHIDKMLNEQKVCESLVQQTISVAGYGYTKAHLLIDTILARIYEINFSVSVK